MQRGGRWAQAGTVTMIGSRSLGTSCVSAHLLLPVNILPHRSRCSVGALPGCEHLFLCPAIAAPDRTAACCAAGPCMLDCGALCQPTMALNFLLHSSPDCCCTRSSCACAAGRGVSTGKGSKVSKVQLQQVCGHFSNCCTATRQHHCLQLKPSWALSTWRCKLGLHISEQGCWLPAQTPANSSSSEQSFSACCHLPAAPVMQGQGSVDMQSTLLYCAAASGRIACRPLIAHFGFASATSCCSSASPASESSSTSRRK